MLPVDPWAPNMDSQSLASQLFAFSLFPYIGFLYFITKSKSAPKLTLFGFYFLLAFSGATRFYLNIHQLYSSCLCLNFLLGLDGCMVEAAKGLRQALRNASGPMKKIIRSCFSNRRGEEVFHLENTLYFLQSMSLLLRQVHLCIKPSIPTECSRYSKRL
ncbi:hypothetical protein Peur_003542 [Populus x canadensis]